MSRLPLAVLALCACVGGTATALAAQETAAVNGRVVDLDGTGVMATLTVYRLEGPRSVGVIVVMTRTGSDGRYEVTNLAPGAYLIEVIKASRGPTLPEIQRAWYPGVLDRQSAGTLTLRPGEHAAGVDIWIPFQPLSGVVGRVAWPVGVAVESITIEYGDPAGARSGVWIVSDSEGRFALNGIRPGRLVLLAHVQTDQGLLMGEASIDFSGDSIVDVPIVVDRPGTVEGRVIYAEDVPATVRATTLTLVQKRMRVTALYPAPVATIASNGRFRAPDALGDYDVELRGLTSGYAVTEVRRGAAPLPMSRVTVGGGETVAGLEVVVSRSR